jgi:hypothetical protein
MENTSKTGNRPPAFQFYPDKWQSHTRRLSDIAYRVYHEIICWMWLHSPDFCSIPSNSEAIACIIAMPCERVSEAIVEIQNKHAPLLRLEGDKLVSNGLRKSHIAMQDRRDKAVMAINTRWNKVKQTKYKRNTDVKIEKYTPTPTPSPTPSPTPITTQEIGTELQPGGRQADSGPVVISIPLIPSQGDYGIMEQKIIEWTELFPGVEVMQTLREIKAWNIANPTRRKTRRGIEKHIVGWLSKEQCKA